MESETTDRLNIGFAKALIFMEKSKFVDKFHLPAPLICFCER